jgi:hypothetical protein
LVENQKTKTVTNICTAIISYGPHATEPEVQVQAKSATFIQGGLPGHFMHVSTTTPIVFAGKNYYT